MEQLDHDLMINITQFLDYKDTILFLTVSKNMMSIYKEHKSYIHNTIFQRYKIWIIDNPLSFTIRTKTKGFTMHKSICNEPFQWFKKIHYKIN